MGSNRTILYVEDNVDNRLLVRRILEAEGYAVLEADDARQALAIVQSRQPSLVLMDINLPGMDGYALTSQLKSLPAFGKTPIVAITANVMKGDRERTLNAGCDGYIQKPIDVDTLPQQLDRYISIRS